MAGTRSQSGRRPRVGGIGRGRTDLHASIDTEGRTHARRADFDSVHGHWDEVRASVPSSAVALTGDGWAALRAAEVDPAGLSDAQALELMTAEGELLDAVCRLADDLHREVVGDEVTYVVNRNINFTNVCYVGYRFCAFAQRRMDADAYSLSLDQVADRAAEAGDVGATEVCMQGGIDPELPGTAYFDLAANASGINDGAAAVVLASERAAAERGLTPLVRLEAVTTAAMDPALMGYAPALALQSLFERTGVTASDVDTVELNEASAIRMLESGFARAADIGRGLGLGAAHPQGPLALVDLVGLDTIQAVAQSLYEEFEEPLYAAPPLLARMVDAGLVGRKANRGFHTLFVTMYSSPRRII